MCILFQYMVSNVTYMYMIFYTWNVVYIISCMNHVLYEWYYKRQQRKPFQGPFTPVLYHWYQIPDILPVLVWGHWSWGPMMASSYVRACKNGATYFSNPKSIRLSTTKCWVSDLLWPSKVHEHVSYKLEYMCTVMGPCVVIVRSWILTTRTWVLWQGHSIQS